MSNAQNSTRVERARFCISPKLGTPGLVERHRLAVEDHVMVGEIGCQRLELRILAGDVAAAPRPQAQLAVVGVDQQRGSRPICPRTPTAST